MLTRRSFLPALAGLAALPVLVRRGRADDRTTLRISEQFGIGYLPFHVVRDQQLIEKHGKARGVDLAVEWTRLGGGGATNDALLSGQVDVGSGGVGPFLTAWDRTRGRGDVKGIVALGNMPIYLNTRNPAVRSIRDLSEGDRIALPTVGVSVQARTLQMAAAAAFGEEQFARLDKYTVTMPHPDAAAALLSGGTEINGHFTAPPFQYQELKDSRIRRILSSYEVLGGPSTFNVAWAASRFPQDKPEAYGAFIDALKEAIAFIRADHKAAVQTYVRVEGSKLDPAFLLSMIDDPEIDYTITPAGTEKYAGFMYKVAALKTQAASFRDYFFDDVHALQGS